MEGCSGSPALKHIPGSWGPMLKNANSVALGESQELELFILTPNLVFLLFYTRKVIDPMW